MKFSLHLYQISYILNNESLNILATQKKSLFYNFGTLMRSNMSNVMLHMLEYINTRSIMHSITSYGFLSYKTSYLKMKSITYQKQTVYANESYLGRNQISKKLFLECLVGKCLMSEHKRIFLASPFLKGEDFGNVQKWSVSKK